MENGTVASSFYSFRADLIYALLKQGHEVYAFTSEYTAEDLKKELNILVQFRLHIL